MTNEYVFYMNYEGFTICEDCHNNGFNGLKRQLDAFVYLNEDVKDYPHGPPICDKCNCTIDETKGQEPVCSNCDLPEDSDCFRNCPTGQ